MVRNSERCKFWKRPESEANWLNSLADAYVATQPGQILVYRHGPVRGSATPLPEYRLAAETASRLGGALVQWPNAPASDDRRTWCWGIQKPVAA